MRSADRTMPSRSRAPLIILAGCLVMMLCLVCALGIAGTTFVVGQRALAIVHATETARAIAVITPPVTPPTPPPTGTAAAPPSLSPPPTDAPAIVAPPTPTAIVALPSLTVPPQVAQDVIPAAAFADLNALLRIDFPANDYYESARRLGRDDVGERTVAFTPYAPGDSRRFITDTGPVNANLIAATDHLYMWVASGLDLDTEQLALAAEQLENDYLPRLLTFFGDIWQPGMDNDPHFSVLHLAEFATNDEIGFFDSSDEYPLSINNASNEQEIIYLNMAFLDVGDDVYMGTLVHEIEHLIQWHMDGNETTWLDEGLAQLAETVNGLDSVDTYLDWLSQPDIQLNSWSYDESDDVFAHYGAAYLLSLYIWEQLGSDAVYDLSRDPANGLQAVRDVLQTYRPDTSLGQFLADWAATNWLDGESLSPRYEYAQLKLGQPQTVASVKRLPLDTVQALPQFGIDYVELNVSGPITITFAGDTWAPLLPVPAFSGSRMWLAPPVDNLSAQLTHIFDLTDLSEATLTFATWYDLEPDWDFAYVTISTDDGATWHILRPNHAIAGQYGPAFGARSSDESDSKDGWVTETISLDAYAGEEIWLRFEMLTDSALTSGAFALDQIAIPELNYTADAEADDGGWQATGFVRTGWQLPQAWSVQLLDSGSSPQVHPLQLNEMNQLQFTIELGRRGGVLAIMPQTPFTSQTADYWLHVDAPTGNN